MYHIRTHKDDHVDDGGDHEKEEIDEAVAENSSSRSKDANQNSYGGQNCVPEKQLEEDEEGSDELDEKSGMHSKTTSRIMYEEDFMSEVSDDRLSLESSSVGGGDALQNQPQLSSPVTSLPALTSPPKSSRVSTATAERLTATPLYVGTPVVRVPLRVGETPVPFRSLRDGSTNGSAVPADMRDATVTNWSTAGGKGGDEAETRDEKDQDGSACGCRTD